MIDLSKPTVHLPQVSASLPTANAQAQSLAALLGIKVGQAVTAQVLDASPITEAEREFLIAQARQALASKSPRAKAELARATLAEAAQTQLLRVVIKRHTVALLSDLKIDPGTRITLSIKPDGRLELLAPRPPSADGRQPPASDPPKNPPPPPLPTRHIGQAKPPAVGEAAPATTTPSEPAKVTARTQAAKERLVHQYRRELPPPVEPPPTGSRQDTQHLAPRPQPLQQQLLASLQTTLAEAEPDTESSERVRRALEALPARVPARLQREVPALFALLKNLTALKQTAVDGERLLAQPMPALRDAVQRSGIMLEHRLREAVPADPRTTPIMDAKHALLAALANVEQLLATGGLKDHTAQLKPLLEPLLKMFIGMKPPDQPEPKPASRANEALQILHAQLRTALAQIQVQQYRTATTLLGDGQQMPPSLLLDLPVRWFDGLGTVATLWQEFKRPEESGRKRREGRARKQFWRVYLELDLAQDGMLGADLGVCDKHMDVRMWADREALAERARSDLDDLRAQLQERGLTVCDLSCVHTVNPERPVRMHCTLIDERT